MMLHYYSFHISYIYSCVSFMPLCLLYKSFPADTKEANLEMQSITKPCSTTSLTNNFPHTLLR